MIVLNTAPKDFQLRWNSIADELTSLYGRMPPNGDPQAFDDALCDRACDLEVERRDMISHGCDRGYFFQ